MGFLICKLAKEQSVLDMKQNSEIIKSQANWEQPERLSVGLLKNKTQRKGQTTQQ